MFIRKYEKKRSQAVKTEVGIDGKTERCKYSTYSLCVSKA
jgi:hypothetical protein